MTEHNYHPLVSIALTTFNGKNLLREQLDSILSQTYQNYEVVMSDDGSDQETLDILEEYCAKDSRFRWSRSPLSRGYVLNTQNAIALCRGEIVVLCDQDDVWFPNKLQEHVNVYRNPEIQWAYNRFVITDQENNEIGFIEETMPDYFRHKTMLENLWGTCIGAAQSSYRSDLLRRALPIPSFVKAHDSWIQFVIWPAKPFFINKVLNTYRQHEKNMVGLKLETEADVVRELELQAIADNYSRLWHYAWLPHLQLWKRVILLAVFFLKKMRYFVRRMVGRSDQKLL